MVTGLPQGWMESRFWTSGRSHYCDICIKNGAALAKVKEYNEMLACLNGAEKNFSENVGNQLPPPFLGELVKVQP